VKLSSYLFALFWNKGSMGGSFNKDIIYHHHVSILKGFLKKLTIMNVIKKMVWKFDIIEKVVEVNVRNRMNVNEQYKNVCLKWMKIATQAPEFESYRSLQCLNKSSWFIRECFFITRFML
jgi:hypothetical protein